MAKELYKNILKRLPSALVMAVSIFGVLYAQNLVIISVLVILVAALLLHEWLQLSKTQINLAQISFLITPILFSIYLGEIFLKYFLVAALIFWIIYTISLISRNIHLIPGISFNNNYLGIFLIQSFSFGAISILLFLNFLEINNFFILFLILFCTALIDVSAYLVGSAIGKTPLFQELSPNKTLEGLIGGLIAVLVFILIMYWTELITINLLLLIALSMPFAFAGDYFESQLKRNQQIKDSGSLIPGHGGVWDRLDSHISVIMVFAPICIWVS